MDYWGGGGQRVCWPPSQIIGGGPGPPWPPPSSYAYAHDIGRLYAEPPSTCFEASSEHSARIRAKLVLALSTEPLSASDPEPFLPGVMVTCMAILPRFLLCSKCYEIYLKEKEMQGKVYC